MSRRILRLKKINKAMENQNAIKASAPVSLLGADKMSAYWPPSYRGRIPVKVRMACDLGPDMWGIMDRGTPRHWVKNNDELPVKVNQHGAMSVVTTYGDLGVKPLECEIIEWRSPNEKGQR